MKSMPWGVRIAALLLYVLGFLIIVLGILIFIDSEAVRVAFSAVGLFGSVGEPMMIMLGILLIAIAVLYVFVGKDLWKGKSWARIAAMIIYGAGVVQHLVLLASGDVASVFFSLAYGIVFCYLAFSRDVKAAFSEKKRKS